MPAWPCCPNRRCCAKSRPARWSLVPLATDELVRPLGIIHRRGKKLSATARRFIDLLRSEGQAEVAGENGSHEAATAAGNYIHQRSAADTNAASGSSVGANSASTNSANTNGGKTNGAKPAANGLANNRAGGNGNGGTGNGTSDNGQSGGQKRANLDRPGDADAPCDEAFVAHQVD